MSSDYFSTAQKYEIDYYGVLRLTRNCTELDIKRAFRALAIRYHPKRKENENSLEHFTLIAEAYEVLSDPFRRAIYDQYGETRLKSGIQGPTGYIPPYVFHGDPIQTYYEFFGTESPYAHIFNILENPEAMLSITKSRNLKCKNQSVITPLHLTLTEIFFGAVKKIKLDRSVFADAEQTCTKIEEKILTIVTNPGIPTDTEILFPEEADQEPNKIPADIIFIVKETAHEIFRRENDNLLMTVNVSLSEALTGTVIKIHTLDDRILRIPITSIISPGYSKTVTREGLPNVSDPMCHGDLIINFQIEFPTYLPVASKNYLKQAFELADPKVTSDCT